MWTCPDCGTMFRHTNQQHSCGTFTVEEMMEGKSEEGIALYRVLEAGLRAMPDVDIRPVATRILFRTGSVAFASVEKIGRNFVDVSFALADAADHPAIKRVFREADDLTGHTARVKSEDEAASLLPLLDAARRLQTQD